MIKRNLERIVIISQYTFPVETPRANRTHQLACELARLGHDVTLYVMPTNYDYAKYGKTHNITVKTFGEMRIYKGDLSLSIKQGVIKRGVLKILRKLIEFPQIELTWRTYKLLKNEKQLDILISIAVPYPLHWGVALYRSIKSSKIRDFTWVADCGDPYMGNPFSKKLFYFKFVERWFCRYADFITVPIESAKAAYYKEFRQKIRVIPQGFDFSKVKRGVYRKNKKPTFIYAGNFYPKLRDPRPFLDYLINLKIDFKFIIYTHSKSIVEGYLQCLGERLEIRDYIDREKLITVCSEADFLINFENSSSVQSPSKLIDYYLSGRPILSIAGFSESERRVFHQFLNSDYSKGSKVYDLSSYDIRNVAQRFLEIGRVQKSKPD